MPMNAGTVAQIRPTNTRKPSQELPGSQLRLREKRCRGVRSGASVEQLYLRLRTSRADWKRRASRSSISVSRCRAAVSSSTADSSGEPANPMSACAAARRVSTRSAPSASSVILTSSPACRPSRRRSSAGRTRRPRASSRAVPRMRPCGKRIARPTKGPTWVTQGRGWPHIPVARSSCPFQAKDIRRSIMSKKAPRCGAFVARPERFELPTFGSVDRRSIQLSYGRSRPANPEHRSVLAAPVVRGAARRSPSRQPSRTR